MYSLLIQQVVDIVSLLSSVGTMHNTVVSSASSPISSFHPHCKRHLPIPDFLSPCPESIPLRKSSDAGRKPVVLSTLAEDTIRYVIHEMLQEKVCPPITTLLMRLLSEYSIRRESTLKKMKEIGFQYRRTAMVTVALK